MESFLIRNGKGERGTRGFLGSCRELGDGELWEQKEEKRGWPDAGVTRRLGLRLPLVLENIGRGACLLACFFEAWLGFLQEAEARHLRDGFALSGFWGWRDESAGCVMTSGSKFEAASVQLVT